MYKVSPEFTDEEITILSPYFTNMDRTIFGLRNLPEVVKGALFSRYSRTDKSLRRVLLDEFIRTPEMGFREIVNYADTSGQDQEVAIKKAEDFYNRVLIGYGDDSIEELGGAHVACERISFPLTKIMEDARIGISPLEKSTRYVYFDTKTDGYYPYVRDPDILQSELGQSYIDYMDSLFDTYSHFLKILKPFFEQKFPKSADETDRAYNATIRAKVCDTARGLLPLGGFSNAGFFGNGRAFRYLITKLYAHELPEANRAGEALYHELAKMIPSFVRRANDEKYGQPTIDYIQKNRQSVAETVTTLTAATTDISTEDVALVDYDKDGEHKAAAAILFEASSLSFAACQARAKELSETELEQVFSIYFSHRQNRFHKPGRALENVQLTFNLRADYNAFRDLQRHRALTQQRQPFTPAYGYVTAPELIEAGLQPEFDEAMRRVDSIYAQLTNRFPAQASYVVPMGYRLQWYFTLNFRELVHICELRTTPQGHPNYRRVVQQMYREVEKVLPHLAKQIGYINLEDSIGLERREAEKRTDKQLEALKQK